MFETGIKVIDLLEPYVQGGKIGMFGGAGVGKTVIIQEMIRRSRQAARRRVGVRRRGRAHPRGQRPVPGDDRVRRHREDRAGVRSDGRAAGRPAARRPGRADDGRVLPRRDEAGRAGVHRQHLPVHAGGVRGVDAARPHAVARWATSRRSPTRWASCRSGSRRRGATRSRRCRRSTCRPTTSPTRRRTRRSRTSTPRPCSRATIAALGIYPAVDPLDSTSRILDAALRGRGALRRRAAGAGDPPAVQGPPGHHRDPRHRRAVRGGQGHREPRAQDPAVPVPAVLRRRAVHRHRRASTCRSTRRSRRSRACADGEYDHLPEQAFFLVGGIEEAEAQAKQLAGVGGVAVALDVHLVTPEREVWTGEADHGRRARASRATSAS